MAGLNTSLGLGLTARELSQLRPKHTQAYSNRFGIMWHGGGSAQIDPGTVFNTKETTFLDKGQSVQITANGATLKPGNGVLFHGVSLGCYLQGDYARPMALRCASSRSTPSTLNRKDSRSISTTSLLSTVSL